MYLKINIYLLPYLNKEIVFKCRILMVILISSIQKDLLLSTLIPSDEDEVLIKTLNLDIFLWLKNLFIPFNHNFNTFVWQHATIQSSQHIQILHRLIKYERSNNDR